MIIVSMGAGLGNQMYEYAFYTRLRLLYPNEIIKADTQYAFPLAHNGIEIFDIFGLNAEIANREEVIRLTKGFGLNGAGFTDISIFRKVIRKANLRFGKRPETIRIQSDFTEYYSDFLNPQPGESVYFLGPFANYHYFAEIEDTIRQLYQFPAIEDVNNQNYERQIKSCNSVSIHVRKGDYTSEGIELTSPEFYGKAIQLIDDKVPNTQYFIFTDDIAYARLLFPNKDKFIIIEGNTGHNSFRDMQLMSLCKHNVTANSTFSFWGAFLNSNPEKIVIAPNLAFTGCKQPFACEDWILL